MDHEQAILPLAADPGFLLSRVGAAIRAGFRRELSGWQLRPMQYRALVLLSAGGPMPQRELSETVGVSRRNLVAPLDGWKPSGTPRALAWGAAAGATSSPSTRPGALLRWLRASPIGNGIHPTGNPGRELAARHCPLPGPATRRAAFRSQNTYRGSASDRRG
jgi:hypothetical protein